MGPLSAVYELVCSSGWPEFCSLLLTLPSRPTGRLASHLVGVFPAATPSSS
jgi:hypothetical protein